MPEYSEIVKAKLEALRALTAKERLYAQLLALYFGTPDGLKVYFIAGHPALLDNEDLSAALTAQLDYAAPVILSMPVDKSAPFADLPRTASIAEDGADFTFSDLDDEISRLVATYGEGVRAEVFDYWLARPTDGEAFDLLLSFWRGLTKAPKEMNRSTVKLSASTGFRSPNMNVPRRPHATSCVYMYGGLLSSQEEIDFHEGCPYNAHLTEEERGDAPLIGVPGLTDCSRRDVGVCFTHLLTKRFWPGFDVRPDPIANNQTKGRNLTASAIGNASNLEGPVRVVIGTRLVKSLALLAYRNETNTNHPDKGFGAGVFEVSEGPVARLWDFRMNGLLVGGEHQNLRLGELGQPATFFSPNVNSFSGTAHAYGRIQGSFNENQAASLTGSIMCRGLRNIRVYSEPGVYAEDDSDNRMWAILKALTSPRWGYGNDYSRYDIESAIECAEWCDENVSMHDPNGNVFAGKRSTCNVELSARSVQQQITDLCTAGRIGLPYEFQRLEVFTPLREETIDDEAIPTFTDEPDSQSRNIIYDGSKSSLSWSQLSDAEMVNQWTVNYDDASNGFAETQLVFGDQRQQLRAGRAYGDRSIRVVNKSQPAFGITNFSEAARLGVFLLYLGPLDSGGIANNLRVKFTTWYSEAMNVRMYKPIRVLSTKLQRLALLYFQSLNLPWFGGEAYEYFRVTKCERKGDLKVEITAQVYPEDFYAVIEDVEQAPPIVVGPPGVNPGGGRFEQPEPIGVAGLEQIGDRLRGRFELSVY